MFHPLLCLDGVTLLLGQVADGDVGALTGEGNRDGAANAAVAAGDQRHTVGEPAEPLVGILAMVGARCHLLFGAGWIDGRLRELRFGSL